MNHLTEIVLHQKIEQLQETCTELSEHLKRLKADMQRVCRWHGDGDDIDSDGWHGECGIHWVFPDGGPVENDMNYCPKCGKPLEIIEEESNG